MGQYMQNTGTRTRITTSGYQQTITKYQAVNCEGCPLRGVCNKQKRNRIVEINHHLQRLKRQAADKLCSEEGIKKRKKRCADVEPVFGNWKQNKGFRRFILCGKDKVSVEIGLIAIAHNLQKLSGRKKQQKLP